MQAKQTLKQQLPRGWQKEIMNKTGFSDTYVSQVVNGRADNLEILNVAAELAAENLKKKKTLQKKLQKVTKHGST